MKRRASAGVAALAAVAAVTAWLGLGLDAFAAGLAGRGVARAALGLAVVAVVVLVASSRALRSRCELEDAEAVIARDGRED